MIVTWRRRLLRAAAVAILLAACSGTEADRPAPAKTPAPEASSSSAITVPVIPGVSYGCASALVDWRITRGRVDEVMTACVTIEELLAAEDFVRTGWDWLAEASAFCVDRPGEAICHSIVVVEPSPTLAPSPAAEPSPTPMTADLARQVCKAGRPDGVYGITAKLKPLNDPGGAHLVWVQLTGFRDLAGKVSGAPDLASDTFYDFTAMSLAPGGYDAVAHVDLVACLVLRATELEHWYYETSPGILYPIHASDAILWVVDVETGRRLGSAWRLRPPASGSGDNYIYLGAEPSIENPGQRPPTEAQVLASISAFFGQ